MGVTCSALTPIPCILVKCIFWRISRMWSSRCQEMMKIWSRREGQTRMKDWQLCGANRHVFFDPADQPLEKRFLKIVYIFSLIAFVTKCGFCSAVVSTKKTKSMRSLKAFMLVRILLFQSPTEGRMLCHVSFPMHGFKSSSFLPFLIPGCFLEARLHNSLQVNF